ncbi:GIY-YIG nuclease family protein [Patescibacteria group bacterium]|nr:GIY-YIG nuclease family protein [Patescibacteria group bacterium]
MTLKSQAKKLPLTPGVYTWQDKNGKPLYIGRATSLRRRVLQYFRPDLDRRLTEMVEQARAIKHEKVDTVLETIILEANLIKKHQPKYNIKDRDDKSFIYIVIPKKVDYPKLLVVRARDLKKYPTQKAHVFGPYQKYSLVKQALKVIRHIFPYSTCTPLSGKHCFNYQIGLCPGACTGEITPAKYQKQINNIIMLLKGEKRRLAKKLGKESPETALALQHIKDVALISRSEIPDTQVHFNRIEAYDISHLSGKETYGAMAVFTNGVPDKTQYRLFKIRTAGKADDLAALAEIIERRLRHPEWPLPDLWLVDGGKPQVDFIYKILTKHQAKSPLLGISKLQNDKLVFPPQTKKALQELAQTSKTILLQARDEAHRFANRGRKRQNLLR